MGKTYKTLKEHYDFGTIIGGAYANMFNKLAEEIGDGKKFKDVEDILNSIWATIPTNLKRRRYAQYKSTYQKEWYKIEDRYNITQLNMQDKAENIKNRVWSKMQILSDLFFNENIWVKTIIVDIFDEEDYEIIEEEVREQDANQD